MSTNPGSSPTFDDFPGGGEMASRIRSLDWSQTPVGPVETWPQSLKTVVRILLTSRYAMWMAWGPELTFFYNDAYRPTLGVKHSWALGTPATKVWAEIWPDIGPRIETVLETGTATWDERLLLFLVRNGYLEETYHTFSYSPLADDRGVVSGILCVVTEDTERVIGERRLRTLRELGLRTSAEAKTVEEACVVAAKCLATDRCDVPFALIYLLEEEGLRARLAGVTGLDAGTPASPETIDLGLNATDGVWPLRRVRSTNQPELVTDVVGRFGELACEPWGESPHSALVLPIAQALQAKLAGFLIAGINPRRLVDDDYRAFLELAAGHVGTTVANARVYEEERRRSEALAELDRAKTAFFSNVSHEFRTPLTLMLGPLEDALAEPLEPVQRERMEILQRNALRLQKLVNTLLDFSRIEAGRMQACYEPTDLAGVTTELTSVFRSAIERAGMRLIINCDPLSEPVYVDRDLWEKVVLNLMSNAFKFTLDGEIEVSLKEEGREAVLRVRDTGTGIPEEQLPHIFERFHRVEGTRARTHEGTGIGLALVQELVKLHGGTVEVASTPGVGTTFSVRLPFGSTHLPREKIGSAPTGASTALGARHYVEEALRWLPSIGSDTNLAPVRDSNRAWAAGDLRRPRIVLADDNADLREYLTRLLSDRYDVEAASDGEQALQAVRRRLPEVVLTDVMMPIRDGFSLLRELRADPKTAGVPVLMLSARAGEEARVQGLRAGADDYLTKPFGARELVARVSATIELARVRREAAEANERASTILDSVTDAFVALDREWRFTFMNAEAERVNGTTREEVRGKSPWEVYPATLGTALEREFRRAVAEQVSVAFEYFYRPWDRWFDVRAYPAKDGGLSVYYRDITDRKRSDEERERLLLSLKENDRRKDEFLAMLAHELRNPLAAISNAVQLTKRTDSAEHREWSHEVIEAQVKNLSRMIDDLLDVSRITRGKIRLRTQSLNLVPILNSGIEAVRPLIEERKHRLLIDVTSEPLRVQGDPTRLEQVIVNLLNNAAKYTESGGRIILTASVEGSEIVIKVEDTGVGMPPELLARAFDLFAQGDRTIARSEGGLGIGLTLVKSLVEMHGGTVTARSEGPGKGSRFTVRLPSAKESAGDPARVASAGAASTKTYSRVLVVDDNLDTARGLSRLLRLLGNEVRTAHDGPTALDEARSFRPDVVLLDIGLPGMDGYEVARSLRDEGFDRTVIIAVSGYGEEQAQARSRDSGFDHHLVKPVDFDSLVGLIGGENG